jgi:hypothetical protein
MRRLLRTTVVLTFLLTTATAIGTAQNSSQDRITKRMPYPNFDIEVLVDGRPLAEYRNRGRTYVDAVRGAEYELRLRNSSPDRVAVALSVDGLNTIDAQQTSAWNASKWVIEPYQTITISGWQMSSERARRFYFTTERDSYAAKLGRPADLGVISAVFFRERNRPVPITRPSDSSPRSDSGASGGAQPKLRAEASRDSEAATGIGRSVRNDVREIDMDLESRPAAELTVRYEYSRGYGYTRGRYCPEP